MDGGFVDNLATAQTVGQMQAKYGKDTPLSLVLTYSFEKDANTEVAEAIVSLSHLFAWDKISAPPGGILTADDADEHGGLRASPQVFSTNINEVIENFDP